MSFRISGWFHISQILWQIPPRSNETCGNSWMVFGSLFRMIRWRHSSIAMNFVTGKKTPRWFKVTFSSPSWRSLNHWKGSLDHPKKVKKNCQDDGRTNLVEWPYPAVAFVVNFVQNMIQIVLPISLEAIGKFIATNFYRKMCKQKTTAWISLFI